MLRSIIKTISALIIVAFLVLTIYMYKEKIARFVDDTLFPKEKILITSANTYARTYIYDEYKVTTDFEPDSYNDLLNIFYTVLNSGWNTFYFYCPDSYNNCVNDVSSIIKDESLLSSINNYVSPYNSYLTVETLINNYGKVTINPIYSYNQSMIDSINFKKATIFNQVINDSMSTRDKIRTIHNYIINNTKYDTAMVNTGVNSYKANSAYGPLINGYAICGGYADAMALFLDDLKIPNYKIASVNHVWNYLYLDGVWYHLDLTWDDPVMELGKDRLVETYFLISTNQLNKLNTAGNHTFDENLY